MLVLRVIILFLMCSNITGQSYQNLARLKLNLTENYIKSNRPLRNQTEKLRVYIDVRFHMVEEFNIMEGVLGTHLTFTLQWKDELIRWNSKKNDNITKINLSHLDVWVPQIALLNPADDFGFLIKNYENDKLLVQYSSNGWALLTIDTYLESTCELSMKYFPIDSHTCHLKISHRGYSGNEVISVLHHVYDDREGDSGPWAVGALTYSAGLKRVSIELSRRPTLLILNLFVPILFLIYMNLFVFYLPVESGEKASFTITVFLALTIFLTIISDQLPPLSTYVPIISGILCLHLFNSALVCTFTVYAVYLYHRSDNIRIPNYLINLTMLTIAQTGNVITGESPEDIVQWVHGGNRHITPPVLNWKIVSRVVDHQCFKFSIFMTLFEIGVFIVFVAYGEYVRF